ncbi:hypothetical protein SLS56_004440 [Neofusicoccum ribis]|uniref:Uncharacterized protein n=1 Tax=Neofusicoccum ribis TaxID=45134 RepID=A0ABR3SX02_9PEZI
MAESLALDDTHLAPYPSHPAPPSPSFTNSTIYRPNDDSYSDADTEDMGSGIATPVTLDGSGGPRSGSPTSHASLRYEDLPPSYEEAQQAAAAAAAGGVPVYAAAYEHPTAAQASPLDQHHQQQPPPFAERTGSDPVLPAVERLVIREKERAASEQGSERSAFSGGGERRCGSIGDGSGSGVAAGAGGRMSFAAVEGLASEHHGVLEVALQWAHPAYHAGDRKEPVAGGDAGLARPVVVPQVNVAALRDGGEEGEEDGDDEEGAYGPANVLAFSRAYATALQAHGVSLPIFIAFLDGLNAVCHAARAPASDDDRSPDAPEPDLSLVETYLARANALFFASRGLLIRVVDVDGLLDDVIRLSASRRSLRDALAGDVTSPAATERERVEALDPWVEKLVWEGLPPTTLGLWDLRGQRGEEEQRQQQQQQQRTMAAATTGAWMPQPTTGFASPPAPTTTTTNAYASGEFYSAPEGVAGGYLDEKAQARAWAAEHEEDEEADRLDQNQAGPSTSRRPFPPFPSASPFPPLGPFPGFGPFPPPPPPPFGDHARWADWGQSMGRRWADWGTHFGRNWAQWGQDFGSRAAAWGQEVGRGAEALGRGVEERAQQGFGGPGAGRGGWGHAGRGGAAFFGGRGRCGGGGGGGARGWGPGGPYGPGSGFCGPRGYGFGGPRGYGFAGRGVGMGWDGRGGHQLRGWGGAGGHASQYGTFGPPAQGEAQRSGESVGSAAAGSAQQQQQVASRDTLPYDSTTTLNDRISLNDNDVDSDHDKDDDENDDAESDSELDEIEVYYLKRMRSIEESAAEALAKGKRSQTDVERERERAIDKANADREKATRKLEAKRKKVEGRREMKAKRKEWKESRSAHRAARREGEAGPAEGRKAEKKRLKKEWRDARGKWKEGRKEERWAKKRERKERRRDGGCGAVLDQPRRQQSQGQGLDVGVAAARDEGARAAAGADAGASTAPPPPQLLWVVVENLEN